MNGFGGWEVWGQGASMVAFWWQFSSYFIASAFFLCPHLGKGVSVLSVASLLKYQFNLWRFHLHYWSTSQRPQEYHHLWELGSQHMNLGRAHSDHSTNSVQEFQCLHLCQHLLSPVFWPFLNLVICFLPLSWKSSFSILETKTYQIGG